MGPIDQLFDALLKWVAGSTGSAASFALNVVSLLFAVVGFWLYVAQKREYRLLFGMLQEFEVETKLKESKATIEKQHEEARARLKEAAQDITHAEEDLKDRLPAAARRAYFENTIPTVERQIHDLEIQLQSMYQELVKSGDAASLKSPELSKVLDKEVRSHVAIAREMDRRRTILSIYTGAAAAIGILLPYPFTLIAVPVGVLILIEAYKLFRLSRTYYRKRADPANPARVGRKLRRGVPPNE